MRHHLGTLILASLLTLSGALASGCGDDESGSVSDERAPTASSPPTEPEPGDEAVHFQLVGVVTETAAGGTDGQPAVPLNDDGSVQQFTAQFDNDAMSTRIRDLVEKAELPAGQLLYGAVVAIGCDQPTDVTVTSGDEGLMITAVAVPSPMEECFAPMTTVAVVLVPAGVVG